MGELARNGKIVPFRKKQKRNKVLAVIFLFILLGFLLIFSPLFNIKHIEVVDKSVGARKLADEQVVNMSNISIGQNLFRVNYFKSKDNVQKNPFVDNVKISRKYFPPSVVIEITERTPSGYFQFMGSYLTVDKDGIVLEVTDKLNQVKVPAIIGIKFKDYVVGKPININQEDKAKFDLAKACFDAIIVEGLLGVINKVDITNPDSIVLWAYNDKYQINLSDGQKLPYKFKMLAEKVLPDREKEKIPGVIDFTIPNKPTFRPR